MTAATGGTTLADRELVITRELAAPRELVFRAFTDASHVSEWWGPRGFRTTTHAQDLRPGGEWRFTMHGPDGTDYENLVRYQRIEAPARLEYQHGEPVPADCFDVTVTFDDLGGSRTRVTLRMLAASAEVKARMVEFGAIEGGAQTLERLGEVLAAREIIMTRRIDAPRALVYRALTDPSHLVQWFGPERFTCRDVAVDLQVGGVWRLVMVGPDGGEYPVHGTYMEIVPNERLVYLDEWVGEFKPTASLVVTITLADRDGATLLQIRTSAASEADRQVLGQMGMVEGWGSSLDKLQAHLGTPRPRLTVALAGDREIIMARSIQAPVARVFEAYTTVEHVRQWWGPHRDTMVSCDMDFRPGGTWRFVQRGLSGNEYAFSGEFREIVPNQRIVQTFEYDGAPGEGSVETLTFHGDDQGTTIRMHSVFPTRAARDAMVAAGMEEGAGETMDRLEAWAACP